jgi:hypothetical protein
MKNASIVQKKEKRKKKKWECEREILTSTTLPNTILDRLVALIDYIIINKLDILIYNRRSKTQNLMANNISIKIIEYSHTKINKYICHQKLEEKRVHAKISQSINYYPT